MDTNKFARSLLFVLLFICNYLHATPHHSYSVIDANQYHHIVSTSREHIKRLLEVLEPYRHYSNNDQLQLIVQQLIDIPYLYRNAMGEGDWQPKSTIYKPGAIHLQQDPVYRLDGFDCQTFVQVAMALLYARDLDTFDKTLLKIAYGNVDHLNNEIVHFYNRNHFVDADLNPNNQTNKFFKDVTSQGELAQYSRTTSVTISRLKWFAFKRLSKETVRVLDKAQGEAMVKRLNTTYATLPYPSFRSQEIVMHYIPKESLAIKTSRGKYLANNALLDKIPTPAVAEIIYNHKNWNIHGQNIKDIIGTPLTVAHFGILYRQSFKFRELIYHKIDCNYGYRYKKICSVTPIYCQHAKCQELMFAHATNGYPHGYYWYRNAKGEYTCTADRPSTNQPLRYCNRVEQHPFFDYLTEKQYGTHWYMNNNVFLGIHIEKLT